MHYLDFLTELHARLQPRSYLEVGLRNGDSLALSQARCVGIDPAYTLTAPLPAECSVFRTTSDEYFARPEPLAPTGGRGFDLAFIDGLHLFEFSLRDFIHAEHHAVPNGVIVFDDMLPRSDAEAARERHTQFWTGDVFKVALALRRYRPDLTCVTADTSPTGLLLVMGVDPNNRVLADNYGEIMAALRTPDPQVVPADIIERSAALEPQALLDSQCWNVLRAVRDQPNSPAVAARIAAAVTIRDPLAAGAATVNSGATALLAAAEHVGLAVEESVAGVLLTLRWPGAAGSVVPDTAAQVLLGDLVLPVRLEAVDADAVGTAWVSGLPGRYRVGLKIGARTAELGRSLLIGPAGELSIDEDPPEVIEEKAGQVPQPPVPSRAPVKAAAPSSTPRPQRRLRRALKKVPGLVPLVRRARHR